MSRSNTKKWIKLDIDMPYGKTTAFLVKLLKDFQLECLGFKVVQSNVYRSRHGNMHYRALTIPPTEIEDKHLALIQLILGDDPMRSWLNIARTLKGVKNWNMLTWVVDER